MDFRQKYISKMIVMIMDLMHIVFFEGRIFQFLSPCDQKIDKKDCYLKRKYLIMHIALSALCQFFAVDATTVYINKSTTSTHLPHLTQPTTL